ncbi:MAG: HAMP domain-containing sensor histidine kinase [Aggregatilineales bacterium]
MTIRKQLTLWYAGLLISIIVLFGTITFFVVRITMIDNLDNTLRESATQIMVNSRLVAIPTFGNQPRVDVQLAALDVFRASNVYVQAWEIVDGVPEFKGASANLASLGDIPLDHDTIGTHSDEIFHNVTIRDVELRVLTKPIVIGERLVGNVQVAADLATVNQALDTLLFIMVVSSGFAILGAGGLSMWFSYRALKPIEDITIAAGSIAVSNDLSTRLVWNGPQDELGRLISVFNHMMTRIEHTFGVQQRFIGDMSHELRTPLTAIRGNLEIAQRYGMDNETMEAIHSEAERMSRLVNDLLMLARADYGGITIDMTPTDLDFVVNESFKQTQLLAKDRDLTIVLGQVMPTRVNGNSNRIKQLILNIMGNAIKFTQDGGTITLSLTQTDSHAVLSIADDGIGIAQEELDHIFDRFYQVNQARTHTGEGFGLGLSIAKWIVDAHKGEINVQSQPEKGTQVEIKLPLYGHDDPQIMESHERPTRTGIPILRRSPVIKPPTHQSHVPEKDKHTTPTHLN